MSKKNKNDGIVYSTNPDYIYNAGSAHHEANLSADQQDLRIWLEKRSGGKMATIIKGFKGSEENMDALARLLKNKCSVGGSVKDGEIILQGDQRTKVLDVLAKEGYKAKKAGS